MILGTGIDIVDIDRIEASFQRFGERFKNRVFTLVEQDRAENHVHRMASYAKRFAAKEAFAKAVGTGLGKTMAFKEIGVVNQESGKPTLILTGKADKALKKLTPAGMDAVIHVSMTDESSIAQAQVIIEARPKESKCQTN